MGKKASTGSASKAKNPVSGSKTAKSTEKSSAAKARTPRLGRGLSSMMGRPVPVQPQPDAATPDAEPAEPQQKSPGQTPDQSATQSAPIAPLPPTTDEASTAGIVHLDPDQLTPNRHQPRQAFDDASLDRLAASIKADGLMQPVVVRPKDKSSQEGGGAGSGGGYEIIAGERRWRAAKKAGLTALPVLIREVDEQQAAELALVENLQREDLNPLDRAGAFAHLIERFSLTHAQVAERVGVERSSVSNMIRLLELAPDVQALVRTGTVTLGQARALLGIADAEAQTALAHQAVAEGWSVRAVEEQVRRAREASELTPSDNKAPSKARAKAGGAHFSDLEQSIGQQLGTKVRIRPGRKKGTGSLTIDFHSLDAFDDLINRLGVSLDDDD